MNRLSLAVFLLCSAAEAATTGTWRIAGVMLHDRTAHTATLLDDGTMLIAGGTIGGVPIGAAEIFDPRTGAFTPAGTMIAPRYGHAAVRLADGRVLIAGGWRELDDVFTYQVRTSEIFDPATRTFTVAGSIAARYQPQLVATPDGGALLLGGECEPGVERFDPGTLAFERLGTTSRYVSAPPAVTASGRIVMTGGGSCAPGGPFSSAVMSVVDDELGTESVLGTLTQSRMAHTAIAIGGETILVAGGRGRDIDPQMPAGALASAELVDVATGTSVPAGSMHEARTNHLAALLATGDVLLAGGQRQDSTPLRSTEIFDVRHGTFGLAGPLNVPRAGAPIVVTQEGRVFIFGGDADATVEEFVPGKPRRRAVAVR